MLRELFFIGGLLCLLLQAIGCSTEVEKTESAPAPQKEKAPSKNPLDTILGDKMLNSGKLRANNFSYLRGMDKKCLQEESDLYRVRPLSDTSFLLAQKRSYSHARHFSLLLRTDKSSIVDYLALPDFSVKGIEWAKDGCVLLLSDWENQNHFWRSKGELIVQKFDKQFQKIWAYRPQNTPFPFQANYMTARKSAAGYAIGLYVMAGCHICWEEIEINITEEGRFVDFRRLGRQNTEALSDSFLVSIFRFPI